MDGKPRVARRARVKGRQSLSTSEEQMWTTEGWYVEGVAPYKKNIDKDVGDGIILAD